MEEELSHAGEVEIEKYNTVFHHSRPLETVKYGVVTQKMGLDSDFDGAYEWLAKEVGFNPLFLAVGSSTEDRRMTGYQDQWTRKIPDWPNGMKYREKGDIPNKVMFSFADLPSGVFVDYDYWHTVLNSQNTNYDVNRWVKKLLFRPTWDKEKWIGWANENPHSVQYVVPELDLRKADEIWVRNKITQNTLSNMGFENAEIKRIPVDRW